jgi:phosphoribosylformimino-5-aminoimidazole carboxamide ribotide isomerase
MTDARTFDVLPAIDLRDGRVVRLQQGDFARETAYSDDPVDVATRFAEAGARWLHVVDLDGARTGVPAHGEVIRAIVAAMEDRVSVEVAGGLRDEPAVASVLAFGARRAVVGTAALRDPGFAGRLVATHGPHRIATSIDIRDGRAVGQGWVPGAESTDIAETIGRLANEGVTTFEVTSIDRDGLLEGPDLELYRRVVALGAGSIIASGGIASTGDMRAIRALGCGGVILGRALYEGGLDLGRALGIEGDQDLA